jgi:hypothetical protein
VHIDSSVLAKGCQHATTKCTLPECRKLIKTQLPYPWYQAMFICLLIFTLTFPFICFIYIFDLLPSAVTAFCAVLAFASMNEIANDIEEPFNFYPPKIDFYKYQFAFNERILAITETQIPEGYVGYHSHEWSPTRFTMDVAGSRKQVRSLCMLSLHQFSSAELKACCVGVHQVY